MRPALFLALAFSIAVPLSTHAKPSKFKVQCPKSWKYRLLWETPDAMRMAGEVKCGSRVTVEGNGSQFLIPVRTADNKFGYIAFDARPKQQQPYTWRDAVGAVANAMDAYARTSDPHIAWCDGHGGFKMRTVETETVDVHNETGMHIGTGTISHNFIACNDGTRIKEM